MFCKNCGQEIDSDSKFCSFCGISINQGFGNISTQDSESQELPPEVKSEVKYQDKVEPEKNNSQTIPESKKSSCGCYIGMILIMLTIVVAVIFFVYIYQTNNKDANGKPAAPFSRDATISDINIDYSYNFPVNVDYTITGKKDIKNLVLTFNFYDSDKNFLKSKDKTIGNLKSGERFTGTFGAGDFTFTELLKMNYVSCSVKSGTVPYMQ